MGELFSRSYQKSLRIANRILASRQDSEDAVQDAYCSALEHIGTFRNDASFSTWVTRIVVNSCHETIRKPFRRMLPISDEILESRTSGKGETLGRSPEAFTSDRQVAAAVNLALSRLPTELLLPFKLFTYSELSIADVAATLDLSVAAVKSRIYRARLRLRQGLHEMWHLKLSDCVKLRGLHSREDTKEVRSQHGAHTTVHVRDRKSQGKSSRRRLEFTRRAAGLPGIHH